MPPRQPRYFPNKPPVHQDEIDPHSELLASLQRISIHNPPIHTCSTGWQFSGLYSGPTSVAYLFYKLSLLYPHLEFLGQTLQDWAVAYLELGSSVLRQRAGEGVDPSHCGIANETLAQTTLHAIIKRDGSLVKRLCAYATVINSTQDQGSDEWLYGRTGFLYYLRLARSKFGDDQPTSGLIQTTIDRTVERILSSPQPWTWHGKVYLGAAHGAIGIVCQLVLSSEKAAPRVQQLLQKLLDMQFASGNFPSSLPVGERDELVQFCHGGPGFVICLSSVQACFPSLRVRIDQAIAAARKDIWDRGMLVNEPCLCHGVAGNALAFEDDAAFRDFLSQMTGAMLEERGWLSRAGHSDSFVGLYTGEAGRAWLWALADKGERRSCLGFDDV